MAQGKIYKIINIVDNKIYIGCTIYELEKRFCEHIYRGLKTDSNTKLYNSIKKYGSENFNIELIEICDLSCIYEREKFYIDYYDTYNNGLNSTYGGEGCLGYVHSPEIRKKISKNLIESGNTHKGKTYEEIYGNECENEKEKRKISVKNQWLNMSNDEKERRINNSKNSLRKNSKYSIDLILNVKSKINEGLTNKEISILYPEINSGYITSIRCGRRWRDI